MVFSGAVMQEVADADLVAAVLAAEAAGLSRKEAIAEVAKRSGSPKRRVFDAMIAAKHDR